MVTIIKHGRKKQCTCSNCDCIFTYEKEDVVVTDYGMNDVQAEVQCPDCGVKWPAVNSLAGDAMCDACARNTEVYNRTCYVCHDHDKWKAKKEDY